MKHFLTLCFLLPSLLSCSQELPRAVKTFMPSLFLNNMDNQRVYQQANIRKNLVAFSRGFENRSVEEIQQSFHYRFLDEKEKTWILEFQYDRNEIHVSEAGLDSNPLNSNDFGFKVYQKRNDKWKDVTLETLPDDFLSKVSSQLPELQKGSRGIYFYNQEPERIVFLDFDKNKILLKQNGTTVLALQWKKNAFVWKK